MKVFVLTDCPSPYQVELFNEIEAKGQCVLEVGYLRNHDPNRRWQASEIRHEAIGLENGGVARARESARRADLVVFNYYRHANAEQLIGERAATVGHGVSGVSVRGFTNTRGPDGSCASGSFRNCMQRRRRSGGLGSLRLTNIGESLARNALTSTCRTFLIYNALRSAEREEKSERVFLFSGSLIARKGVDLLVAAFARLAQEFPNVRLRIVGDGELRVVSERVDFVGFRDWQELPREYAAADVLCVPSRYDGWGLVVPEGLASGLPVIATDRMGAALEFVETGRNGWLISAGDEEALLSAMREAVVTPLRELGQRAQESVSGHTLQSGADRFCRFAQETIDRWDADDAD